MVVWEKSVFCPEQNHQGPWGAEKCSWCACGKSQWKALSSFLRCWKGSEVDGLEASFYGQCPQMLLKFIRDQVWLMLSTYLLILEQYGTVLSSKASKWTRMCPFHYLGIFIPLHCWLMNEVRKENGSSPQRLVTGAGGFCFIIPPQQPVSMG